MTSRVTGLVLVVTLGSVVAGCGGSGEDEVSHDAQVYVATIRDVLTTQPPPSRSDILPVVYVMTVGEEAIAADVQAEVVGELDEDADIRFADERVEAVHEDKPEVPVRDEGVLVAFGDVPDEEGSVDVEVEIYRSVDNWSRVALTVERRSSQWTVTASSVLPADDT